MTYLAADRDLLHNDASQASTANKTLNHTLQPRQVLVSYDAALDQHKLVNGAGISLQASQRHSLDPLASTMHANSSNLGRDVSQQRHTHANGSILHHGALMDFDYKTSNSADNDTECNSTNGSNCTTVEEVENDLANNLAAILGGAIGGGAGGGLLLFQIILGLIFAYFYKQKVVDKIQPFPFQPGPPPGGNQRSPYFNSSFFGCIGDLHLCLHVTFCTACRAAHTWQVGAQCGFWNGVFLMGTLGCCFPCILGPYFRGDLRRTLGLAADPVCDIFRYLFCTLCAIGQDAMEIDAKSQLTVKCCCKIEWWYPNQVEEQPLDGAMLPV